MLVANYEPKDPAVRKQRNTLRRFHYEIRSPVEGLELVYDQVSDNGENYYGFM